MAVKKSVKPSQIKTFSIENLRYLFGVSEPERDWPQSIAWAIVTTAVMLTFAVVVNQWIGRTIHWDWVVMFGSIAFIGLSVGRKARIL
ncbi:MAG: hypothetical protein HQ478_13955 [Chloroflexi bacterium]|nr:hypothetical protein [Chloroflexota bacterium]